MSIAFFPPYQRQQYTENERFVVCRGIVSDIVETAMAEKASNADAEVSVSTLSKKFLVSDLKKELTSGTKIYRLLPNGEKVDVGDGEYLASSEIFLEPSESLEGFPCSHRFLEQHWQPSDYEFILSKGRCSALLDEFDCILMQRGMLRFGCPLGFSIDAIKSMLEIPASVLRMEVTVPCQPDLPGQASTPHTAHFGIDMLETMHLEKGPKICPGEISPSTLQPSDKQLISERLHKLGPLIEESKRQQTRPYYCGKCQGYLPPSSDKILDAIKSMREKGQPAFACPGCNRLICWTQDCSMVLCRRENLKAAGCISGTKTCAFCVQGNTRVSHDLRVCSAKISEYASQRLPLPPVRLCTCSK